MIESDRTDRAIIGLLLEAHPKMLTRAEVRAALPDVPRLELAIDRLTTDGMVSNLGDIVGVTRAVVRFDALGL
jgi:hypothetical protein